MKNVFSWLVTAPALTPATALAIATTLTTATAQAQHDHEPHLDEIIVSSSQNKTLADTALPVSVLSGEQLRKQAAATLGETIASEPGVQSSSFGNGVGQPVIRGLSGNRVSVLQGNLETLDAANLSPDHASAVEALLADRIEIIRGPSTLLYGNGAMGGVVNVIDNRIPESRPDAITGGLELRGNTVDDGKTAVGKMEGAAGSIAWHLDGMVRDTNDLKIPDYAIDEAALEEAHHDDDPGMPEEEHEEAVENTDGYIGNSNTEAHSGTAGISWVGEKAFAGVAISTLENEYGLPPGAHVHEHGEEEEHEEEEHHEEEHHAEVVRLNQEQTRIDAKAGIGLSGPFEQFTAHLNHNDYEHVELEGDETGTVFTNRGLTSRFTLNQRPVNGFSGVLGLQAADSSFEARGEEAFIPKSDIQTYGLFAVETLETERFIHEFGLRIDRQSIDTRGQCDNAETSWSGSLGSVWKAAESLNVSATYTRSERAPSVEELYSNVDATTCTTSSTPVEHLATARLELGNPALTTESSNNIELGIRKYQGPVRFHASVYYNQFDDFIYLADTGELDEVIVSEYLQDDTDFYGLEAELTFPLLVFDDQHLDMSLFGDLVKGELDSGQPLPRIPPARLGAAWEYLITDWAFNLRIARVDEQSDVAPGEATTGGYTRIDAGMDYHLPLGDNELLVFLKGQNLTDEEIRDHTSFMKNYAPAAGRGYVLGLRLEF